MDATVNSLALADELRLAAKVVANKPAVPILGSVLVRADGGQLILSATDHEVTVTAGSPPSRRRGCSRSSTACRTPTSG